MPTEIQLVDKFNYNKIFSPVALRVNQLISSETSTMQDFEEVIKLDPILSFRLLRMVNSCCFGLPRPIESIQRAIPLLGLKTLRNMMALDTLKEQFKEGKSEKGFSRRHLWNHTVTVATLANMIAIRIFGQKGEDAFLAGIMHDIGLVIEDQVEGGLLRKSCEAYQQDNGNTSLVYFEKKIIGTDHARVGAIFVEGWGEMTWGMYNAIRFHHEDISDQPISSLPCIIQIAESFANRLNHSNIPGRYPPIPTAHLNEHIQQEMPEYTKIIEDLPGELEKAGDLFELESSPA